ncbi:MAG: DUF5343 domain-containing protein [Candidatus Fermentibacteraceae bacterium]
MASFPAIHDPGIIEKLLDVIESRDPPNVVDIDFLDSAGLRRETDEQLMQLLEFLGYLDEAHRPTNLWRQSRDGTRAPALLGNAVHAAYWKLFDRYPDAAETTDGSTLMSFFREQTDADERTAAYMILTFKVLCDLSDFQAAQAEESLPRREEAAGQPAPEPETTPEPEPEEEGGAEEAVEPEGDGGPMVQPREMERPPETPRPAPEKIVLQLEVDVSAEPELAELVKKVLRKRLGG